MNAAQHSVADELAGIVRRVLVLLLTGTAVGVGLYLVGLKYYFSEG